MRIAFHVPRASYLAPGFSGDKIFVRSLIAGLEGRGHVLQIVSELNARSLWRGKIGFSRLIEEAQSVHRRMRGFDPDAYLVYGVAHRHPDFFCWWQDPRPQGPRPQGPRPQGPKPQGPRPYVLLAADLEMQERVPLEWRSLFVGVQHESLRRAHRVAAYHPKSQDRLAAFGIPGERLSLLPPAPAGWQDIPAQPEARRALDLPQKAPVILCASRLPELKREEGYGKTEMVLDLLDLLGQATALPPETVMVIAGDGPGRRHVEEAAARLGSKAKLRLAGAVDHADMPRYFAACDFFVYPNPVDRPWLSVLEAQLCGVPVVTMHSRSAELTVDAGSSGLLARDGDEFKAQVSLLANDRGRCAAMGRVARDYALRCHTVERRLDEIEGLLAAAARG